MVGWLGGAGGWGGGVVLVAAGWWVRLVCGHKEAPSRVARGLVV